MNYLDYIIPVLAVVALCAGWVATQLLARKMKTKNHITNMSGTCGTCTCGGVGDCEQDEEKL